MYTAAIFLLLARFGLGSLTSDDLLRNIKKQYPKRNFERLEADNFERYIAVARVKGEDWSRIGIFNRRDSLAAVSYTIDCLANYTWPLMFFPQKAANERYGDVLYEVAQYGAVKIWPLKG
ncbi:unnamed protein product [Bursaphelenchus xylophilus]|nr:unnamed protein product [Bursaphelenchus xylophilus]CAG9106044.1 unnamed protein product [Bursaphelenchus xylophilus]